MNIVSCRSFKDAVINQPSNFTSLNSPLSTVYIVEKYEKIMNLEVSELSVKYLHSFYKYCLIICRSNLVVRRHKLERHENFQISFVWVQSLFLFWSITVVPCTINQQIKYANEKLHEKCHILLIILSSSYLQSKNILNSRK